MTADELLGELRRIGGRVWFEDGALRVAVPLAVPSKLVNERLVPALREHAAALRNVVAADEAAIGERVAVMRAQTHGPIVPILVYRAGPLRPGGCISCGSMLNDGQNFRCDLCRRAAQIVTAAMTQQT